MEGPKKPSALDAALAQLEKNILERERNGKNFETPHGFSASLRFYDNGFTNLTLKQAGLYSVFAVYPDGVTFNELRGPDDELLTDAQLVRKHSEEAHFLFTEGLLEKHSRDEDGQFELDI